MALEISVRAVLAVESAPLAAVAVDWGGLVVPERQQAAVLEQQAAVPEPDLVWAAWAVALAQAPQEVVVAPVSVAVEPSLRLAAAWSARPRASLARAPEAVAACMVAVAGLNVAACRVGWLAA
ncbi:hypothetical protein [Streptomyces enissocaesilis]|uniref:hypothetical protein n=1 Tax=Streptomyces enissocaesilis TaxID=332589 RepID=UPI0031D82582